MGGFIRILGGVLLFILLSGAGAGVFASEAARVWDALSPGTRPTRRQAADWALPRARSAWSAARAAAVRARPSGFRPVKVRGVVLDDLGASPRPPAPAASARPAPAADRIVTGTVVTPAAPATPSSPANGRTIPVTSPAVASAPAEDITTAYARLAATVAQGNINDKIAAYEAMSESFDAAAAALAAIATSMEEESMYGPEITEPAHALAAATRAAARDAAETAEQLRSLAGTPVGEVPASRHRAPDRRELSESGGR
jgi:hypothetical protein